MFGLYKRYRLLKLAFQSLLVANAFLVAWGLVALNRYLEQNTVTQSELLFVGAMVAVVGFVIPGFILYRIQKTMKDIRRRAEEQLAALLGDWLKTISQVSRADSSLFLQPLFWIQILLGFAEAWTENSHHPALVFFNEMSPFLRSEIKKHLQSAGASDSEPDLDPSTSSHKKTGSQHSSRKKDRHHEEG